jgi:hypothetical protein
MGMFGAAASQLVIARFPDKKLILIIGYLTIAFTH